MAKVITARDMVVIKVITAFAPDVVELTIIRYEGRGPENLRISMMAYVKVPGNSLVLHLVKMDGQWVSRWLGLLSGSGLIGSRTFQSSGCFDIETTYDGYIFKPRRNEG
mgnify:CR=1 FL=1